MTVPIAASAVLLLAASATHSDDAPRAPAAIAPVPDARQLAWHERQYYAFVHFGPNTFTDREWGEGREDPQVFAPTDLDCRQWARTFREAGMSGVIITAKHHDGFCLWPSQQTDHTVAASGWRNGQGDVLRELADACRAEQLWLGVYLSPWDRNHPTYGDSPRYNQVFQGALREVLGDYGPIVEVWFDGACGEGPTGRRQVYDWPAFHAVVRELAPDASMFSDAGPDVRWVGNEHGIAGETNWCMLRRDEFYPGTPNSAPLTEGQIDGTHWVPAECDVSIRPGWFYHPAQDAQVKSTDELEEIWYASIGRGANLLLNVPPDRRGLIHAIDAARLRELRERIDATFADDLAAGHAASASEVRGDATTFAAARAVDGDAGTYWATDDDTRHARLTIDLGVATTFDRVVLREPIALGQRIAAFRVVIEPQDGAGETEIARGTTIGARRILRVPVTTARRVAVEIVEARACPLIAAFELYRSPAVAQDSAADDRAGDGSGGR